MKTKLEVITPEMATEILDKHNPRNRTISEGTVQAYATDMKNGRWSLTHQGLAFDVNGNLLDGQHRLWAIVFSGKEMEFNVTRDLPVDSFIGGTQIFTMDAIDKGRQRSTGQQFGLSHNIKNGNVVAAAVRGIAVIVSPHYGGKRLSTANSLFIYDLYGRDVESIVEIADSKNRVSHITAPLSMYHHGEPDKAKEFIRQLVSLENLSSPVRTLKKYLDGTSGRGQSDKLTRVCANAILAFNDNRSSSKFMDNGVGIEYLVGMFPSLSKKIRDAVTPCRSSTTIANFRKVKA